MEDQNIRELQGSSLTLPVSILAAAVLISGSIIYMVGRLAGPTAKVPSEQVAQVSADAAVNLTDLLKVGGRDVILGEPDAPVTFIEYGDYQCPFCARFFKETEPQLRENFVKSGEIRMIYRDLAFLSQESELAAQAAECAKDQGKFWAYHDALYREEAADGVEHNGNLNGDLFIKLAEETGMKTGDFIACYDGKKYEQVVKESTARISSSGIAAALGVRGIGTPASFINGKFVSGAQPYGEFKIIIEEFLAKK